MSDTLSPVWDFHGGLHLDDHKTDSNGTPIAQAELAARLTLPMQQHIGQMAESQVQVGDKVLKGQLIARASDYVSANIHAPTSGTVVEIAERPIAHPSGLNAPCIVIESDGEDQWGELPEPLDYLETDPAELRDRLRWAGIVGMGGAVFPTSVKTNTTGRRVDTLILNAAECEPYITCDDRLMREQPGDVIDGALILRHILGDPLNPDDVYIFKLISDQCKISYFFSFYGPPFARCMPAVLYGILNKRCVESADRMRNTVPYLDRFTSSPGIERDRMRCFFDQVFNHRGWKARDI